ncbi:MAG: hypothetical protein PHO74_03885 [Weeksellaceae bacterium]|nr:hypothetical protein [Weeksellaceae bacterium]
MFIVVFPKLFRKKFRGLTIYPFVFLKEKLLKENKVVMFHERIHLRQQLEMLWLPFFLWYGIEFLIRWIQYKNRHTAYFNICFEREAYTNEKNFDYLKNRKLWSFIKYL